MLLSAENKLKSNPKVTVNKITEWSDEYGAEIFEKAISYCKDDSYVIIGTNDEAYEAYKKHCEKHKIYTLYIENANHSLEIQGQIYENINLLKKVMEFIEI